SPGSAPVDGRVWHSRRAFGTLRAPRTRTRQGTLAPPPGGTRSFDVAVVGAGVFGTWTAWHLRRRGLSVALLDAHAPGHTRASSGGETRVTRMGYGAHEVYTRWSWRSLAQWKELGARAGDPLFHETGVFWLARADDALSLPPPGPPG